jgi:hypothetical protein
MMRPGIRRADRWQGPDPARPDGATVARIRGLTYNLGLTKPARHPPGQ